MEKHRETRVLIFSPGAQVEIAHIAKSMHENSIPFLLISSSLISHKSYKLIILSKFLKGTTFQPKISNRIVEIERSQVKTPFLILEFIRTYLPNTIQGIYLVFRNVLFDFYALIWILLNRKYIAAAIFQHHSGALAISMAKRLGIKTILNVSIAHHRWIEVENNFETKSNPEWSNFLQFKKFSKYEKWMLESECRNASCFLVASTFTKSTLPFSNSEIPTHVIPLGTSNKYKQTNNMARHYDQIFRIIVVGQLTQRKGISYILEAFESAALPSTCKLIFAGRDSSSMKNQLQQYRNVELMGHLTKIDLNALMSRANLFICNSLVEGFSLATLDAMASGLPVIASDRTFAEDIISHGVNGFIVNPRDISKLALTIRFVYENPDVARKISLASAEVASHFTWALYRKNISNLISKIIQD